MVKNPSPKKAAPITGAIQWIFGVAVQPMINNPIAKEIDPIIIWD